MVGVLLITFIIGLIIGLPVAIVMGLATLAAIISDGNIPWEVLPQRVFSGIDSFPLLTIPFFILAADLMSGGKLTDLLIKLSNDLIGNIKGGLGHVNVLISVFFAGISGSALADAAGPSAVVMRMMRQAGYDKYYSGALSAATSVIGMIIPPSILMIIYALTSGNTSVMGLFLAGIIPGLLIALLLMIYNHYISIKNDYQVETKKRNLKELLKSLLEATPALLMPIILLGGILSGIFTPTEAAAVAVGYAILVGLFVTKALRIKDIPKIFIQSSIVTSSILLIIAMGAAFSWILTYTQVPQMIAEWLLELTDNPILILFLVALFALVTGMFVDTIPALIILVPILSPVASQLGNDPIQVAMVIILSVGLGMLTPPVAPLLFVISSIGRLKLEKLSLAILPLFLVELIVVVLIILVPEISTFIPNFFKY
ncbi:TRAP transporter large permease [Sporosarcina sp. 179-K 8C2 HS]|uniref:TRAP transporter large permease n=1 Tax=Sporosarcina sp. 179-K 8C2 HS TaxID=3142387 RepID=UPI0039A38C57